MPTRVSLLDCYELTSRFFCGVESEKGIIPTVLITNRDRDDEHDQGSRKIGR